MGEKGLIFVYKPPIYIRYDEVRSVNFERSGGSTRSFDISVALTNNDIVYTFSSIEKGEYGRLYEFLKSRKIIVKTSGKTDGKSGLDWGSDDRKVDHHLNTVIANAEEFSGGSEDMSSDDTDFNPDALEALSAKEEYDSEPSTTSSEDSSEVEGSDEEAVKKREEKAKRRVERRKEKELKKAVAAAASTSAPRKKRSKEGGGGERKTKRTKLPGQPKKNQSAYFIWMNVNRKNIQEKNPGLGI